MRGSILVFVSLAGVACGMTLVWLAMRSVLGVGGYCAEGGPYEIRQHCPSGAWLAFPGIWGGLIFAGMYAWQAAKNGAASLVVLFWSALFMSLGYNFLDFGIRPAGESGLAWGALIPGVVFVMMGGIPLLWAVPYLARQVSGRADAARPSVPQMREQLMRVRRARAGARRGASVSTPAAESFGSDGPWIQGPVHPQGAGVVSELERLDALHRSGALDDEEYELAKRRVLDPGQT
jgi:hypothetical protein